MLVRLSQSANAQSSMLVTPSGIVTLSRLMQLRNASSPMLVIGLPLYSAGIERWVASPV